MFRISNILKHKMTLQFYPDSHMLCFVKIVWLYDVENLLTLCTILLSTSSVSQVYVVHFVLINCQTYHFYSNLIVLKKKKMVHGL